MRTMTLRTLMLLALFLVPISSYAEKMIVTGPKVPLGLGWAASTVVVHHGKVKNIGMILSGKALEGLPHQDTETLIELPPSVFVPPYNHFIINWNPHGHEPAGVYDAPHFDFHFYFISYEDQHNILCDGSDNAVCLKQPDADKIPPYYVPGPAGVPMMGWHWVDPRSPEFNGKPFTATYIYGFYNGEVTFVEPMITLDFLKSYSSFCKDVPVPTTVSKPGYYPTNYSISYDVSTDTVSIMLNKLVWLNDKAIH